MGRGPAGSYWLFHVWSCGKNSDGRRRIDGAGHELYFAEDGERALEIYVNESIHVVITDLLMPHVGGVELIGVLKRLFPDAAVIAISGKGREELARATFAGALATLTKPVEPEEMLEVVE